MAMNGSPIMEFVQRYQALQVHRDTSLELIKVRCFRDGLGGGKE